MVAWSFDETLKLLHPFMPFMTEELWARMSVEQCRRAESVLALAQWPTHLGPAGSRPQMRKSAG